MKNHLNIHAGKDWLRELVDWFLPVGSVLVVFAALSILDEFLPISMGAAWGL